MKIVRILCLGCAVVVLLNGCAPLSLPTSLPSTGPTPGHRDTASPIRVNLEMSTAPSVDEHVTLACQVVSAFDAPGTRAWIELPDSAVVIDGSLEWQGDLAPNVPVTVQAVIAFEEEGDWTIRAVAKHAIDETNWWGDEDYLYLSVGRHSGRFGFPGSDPGGELETDN